MLAFASNCKLLRRIRIENTLKQEEHGLTITNKGLMSLATNCFSLESFSMYVNDVENSSLEAFAKFCPRITDFRLALLESASEVSEPLDSGFESLLRCCRKIRIYLKPGGLTDKGLESVGELGVNLKWVLLGCVGDSDAGFVKFASGCRKKLRKLEMRNCPFTEAGICLGIRQHECLRYAWFQQDKEIDCRALSILGGIPEWRVEVMAGLYSVLCYRSLVLGNRLARLL